MWLWCTRPQNMSKFQPDKTGPHLKGCLVSMGHALLDQISRSVVSDSLRPLESQHTRPPHPSPTPWVHSNSRRLSRWCHPAISSSVRPLIFRIWRIWGCMTRFLFILWSNKSWQRTVLYCIYTFFSRGSSWPRDQTCISCSPFVAGGFFTSEPPGKPFKLST